MSEAELDESATLGVEHGFGEDPDHLGAGAPGQMEAGYGVAVAVGETAAAFSPADDRRDAQAEVMQVLTLLGGCEVDVGASPLSRPVVLVVAVETRRAHPVLKGEFR
ncbi:Uncharacterised protein [Mycobacteroides abscessus subsp. abscessus]|nr:Uncharacterised protein [Mycobacteroides abscessus subsp. abscessus]